MVHPFTPDRRRGKVGVCGDPDCRPCVRFANTVFDRPTVVLDLLDGLAVDPGEARTDVVFLDHDRSGVGVVTVAGTDDPDAVLAIGEVVAEAFGGHDRVAAVVMASHRPDGGADLDDIERWLELDGALSDAGIELIEWLVVGVGGVACPRELVGEPARWTP